MFLLSIIEEVGAHKAPPDQGHRDPGQRMCPFNRIKV